MSDTIILDTDDFNKEKVNFNDYSILYFHFLDGLIDEDVGESKDKILGCAKRFNLINDDEILFIDDIILNGTSTKELRFYNIDNEKINIFPFDINNIDDELSNIETVVRVLNLFKYTIYRINQNSHATSNLITINNNKLYFMAFNSGDGIENNERHQMLDGKSIFSPFYGIEICDLKELLDIKSEFKPDKIGGGRYIETEYIRKIDRFIESKSNDIKNGFKKIFGLLLLNQFYSFVNDKEDLSPHGNQGDAIKNYTKLANLCELIDSLVPEFDIYNINIHFDITYYDKSGQQKIFDTLNDLKDLKSLNYTLIAPRNEFSKTILCNGDKYYKFLLNMMDRLGCMQFNLESLSKSIDLDKFIESEKILNELFKENFKINQKVISKINVIWNDKKPYIIPQESGSCTWFSLYWVFIFKYIFSNNCSKYIDTVYNINNKLYTYVKIIFTRENISKIYCNHDPKINIYDNKISYYDVVRICQKFIDIKLLDSNLIYDLQDNLFNCNFKVSLENVHRTNDFIWLDKNTFSMSEILNLNNVKYNPMFIQQFNQKFSEFYFEKNIDYGMNKSKILIMYKLYIFLTLSERDFFVSNEIKIDTQTIRKFIRLIIKNDSFVRYEQQFIRILIKFNELNNIYSSKKLNDFYENIDIPSDFLNLIPIILYLGSLNLDFIIEEYSESTVTAEKLPDIGLGTIDKKKELLKCIVFIKKMFLIDEIYNTMIEMIYEFQNYYRSDFINSNINSFFNFYIGLFMKGSVNFSNDDKSYRLERGEQYGVDEMLCRLNYMDLYLINQNETSRTYNRDNSLIIDIKINVTYKKLKDYEDMVLFLCRNPNYLFKDVNDEPISCDDSDNNIKTSKIKTNSSSQFLRLNSDYIKTLENGKIYIKLIEYLCYMYISEKDKTHPNLCFMNTILLGLENLLVPKYANASFVGLACGFSEGVDLKYYDIELEYGFKEFLNEKIEDISKSLESEQFYTKISTFLYENKDNLIYMILGYDRLIRKYFPNKIINYYSKVDRIYNIYTTVNIGEETYIILTDITTKSEFTQKKNPLFSVFSVYFNVNSEGLLFLIPETLLKYTELPESLLKYTVKYTELPESNGHIYILNQSYFLKIYNCEHLMLKRDYKTKLWELEFRINKMLYSGNPVIKFSDIKYPFKYTIPLNTPYFIYNENDLFKVVYFISDNYFFNPVNKKNVVNEPFSLYRIINKKNVKSNILTFTVNPNTNFYIVLEPVDDFSISTNPLLPNDIYSDYIINYSKFKYLLDMTGYNSYNIIYCSDFNINKSESYHFNKYNYELKNYSTSILKEKYPVESIDLSSGLDIIQHNSKYIQTCRINNVDLIYNIERSIKKLDEKINKYYFIVDQNNSKDNIREKFKNNSLKILQNCLEYIENFTEDVIKNSTISELLVDPNIINTYLKIMKTYNLCSNLIKTIDRENDEEIFSFIKIQKDYFRVKDYSFKYKFEVLFELVNGNEILKEQMERYIEIAKSFTKYQNEINSDELTFEEYKKINKTNSQDELFDNIVGIVQKGGNNYLYPLHHFMMGKGKSAILTPLLSIRFSLLEQKKVIIIVPTHLVKQTILTIQSYINIFSLKKDMIQVYSESNIKFNFLESKFKNVQTRKECVFLIDEFDTIIDPVKSNFNITQIKDIKPNDLIDFIKWIVENNCYEFDACNLKYKSTFGETNIKLLINEIKDTIIKINSGELKENINWGIDPFKCISIPYMGKDKPILNSSFTSSVLTIFLTLYYYIDINEYKITNYLLLFLIRKNLVNALFGITEADTYLINKDYLNNLLENKFKMDKKKIWDIVFEKILNQIVLPKYQSNTSFIDIIKIPNIFKVGYSGTVNILLPENFGNEKFDKKEVTADFDEEVNVKYAIINSKIFVEYNFNIYYNNIKNYDALIDIVGLFKNEINYTIGNKIYLEFKNNGTQRDIIYIDENDNKLAILSTGELKKYNQFYPYVNPFIYYSQSHIVGIDIKQDNYPNMKGLCLVDLKSLYTDVAQAIFRLRKINMGHSVDFVITSIRSIKNGKGKDKDITITESLDKVKKIDSKCFYDLIKLNEETILKNKEDLMNYQCLKCLYREVLVKKNIQDDKDIPLIDIHKEIIKYYYKDSIREIPSDNKKMSSWYTTILDGIINYNDILNNEILSYWFNKINSPDTLIKLVYGIGGLNMSSNIELEQEKEKEKQKQLTQEISINTKIIDYFQIYIWANKYSLHDIFDNIDKFYCLYDKITIKIDDILRIFPGIFSNYNINNYSMNKNHTGLVLVYVKKFKNFLLIPGYSMYYFNNENFIIFNFEFKIIVDTYNLISDETNLKINQLKENIFYKVLSNRMSGCEIDLLTDEFKVLILYLLIQNKKNNDVNKIKLYGLVGNIREGTGLEKLNKLNEWLNKQITEKMILMCIEPSDNYMYDENYILYHIIKFNNSTESNELNKKYKKLYHKYKLKYLKMKNNIN